MDQNRDGLFEASIFLPYDQKESQPQKVAIHPIPLKPSPAIVCARAAAIYAHRRLRVTAITEVSVTFGIEDAISYEGLLTTGDYQPDYGPRLSLYLKAGEEGSIDGFALRVEGQNGAWRVTVKGAFTPWVTTEKAATIVKIGPQKLPPRWN